MLKRHPLAAPASILGLLLAVIGTATFTWLLAEERDQARASEARAIQTADFTATLLSNTSAHLDADSVVPVTDLLQAASQRVTEELAQDPLIALPLHLALGEAYMSWARYTTAFEEAETALNLAEQSERLADQARALDLMARVQHDLGNPDESLRLTRRAFEIMRVTGNSMDRVRLLTNMAISLNEAGHRRDALPVFETAEAAMRDLSGDEHPDLAWLLNNHGWALHALGHYDEALGRYDASIALLDQNNGPDWDRALTLSNRAGLKLTLGEPTDAVEDWQSALTLLQSVLGEVDHPGTARGHHLLSRGLRELGQFDQALEHSNLAVAMNERLFGENHRWLAMTLIGRALVHRYRKDWTRAESDLDRSARIMEAEGLRNHLNYAEVLMVRGQLALDQGQIDRAIDNLRQAQTLAQLVADTDQTPSDRVEWSLAHALAEDNPAAGKELALSVIDRLQARFDDRHPHLRIYQVFPADSYPQVVEVVNFFGRQTSDSITPAELANRVHDACMNRGLQACRVDINDSEPGQVTTATSGSGVIVGRRSIVTNAHVVGSCREIYVGDESHLAERIAVDRRIDLAVLRTDVELPQAVRFSGQGSASLGEPVITSGFPLAGVLGSLNVTTGTVSSTTPFPNNRHLFQMTAPVQPGSSGGAVLNQSGELMGIIVSRLSDEIISSAYGSIPQNVNFAIQLGSVKAFLDQHGIAFGGAQGTGKRSIEAVASAAEHFTVRVNCR